MASPPPASAPPVSPAPVSPAPGASPPLARLARAALLAGLAGGPAAWLLLPGLLARGAVPGAPTAGIYPLLHRWWAASSGAPPRFPSPGAEPERDTLAWLLQPLVAATSVDSVVKGVMLLGAILTVIVAFRYARRATGDAWGAAAATAVFAVSPAVVAGVSSGDLDAWHGWALLALPLVSNPAALAVGLAIAIVAPTMIPAALLPAAIAAWGGAGRGRWWPLVGWGVAVGIRMALGWPGSEGGAGTEAWFAALTPAVEPERVYQVYVGFAAVGLIGLAGAFGGVATRPWWGMGVAALVLALVSGPAPPERFLHLVPLAAVLGAMVTLRARVPAGVPAGAVLLAAVVVSEGWKGVAAPVPLPTAPLADPAPVSELAEGPVLDLPATQTAIKRGLWYQVHHGRPIATDVAGHVAPDVAELGATLTTGGCADVAASGFHTVVARREGALRELAPLQACLGKPAWDDGAVAVWRVGGGE